MYKKLPMSFNLYMFIANKFLIKNIHYFFLFLYINLLIGFLYDENTVGGAAYDFSILSKAIISFSVRRRLVP